MLPSWPSWALEYWNPAAHTGCQSGALSSKLLMWQPASAPRTRLPDTPALLGRNSDPALLPLAPSAPGPAGHSQTDRLPVWTEASSGAAGPGVSAAWRLFSKPAWQHLGTGHSGCSGRGTGGQAPPPTLGGWLTLSRVSGRTGSPCRGVRLQPWPDSTVPESAAPARLAPPWGLGAGRVGCPRGHRLGQPTASLLTIAPASWRQREEVASYLPS